MLTEMDLKASLALRMDDHLVKIECNGRRVAFMFTSLRSVIKFASCCRSLNKHYSHLTQEYLEYFEFTYYLGDKVIGESRLNLPYSWLGNSLGIKKSKFYLGQIIGYIFNNK